VKSYILMNAHFYSFLVPRGRLSWLCASFFTYVKQPIYGMVSYQESLLKAEQLAIIKFTLVLHRVPKLATPLQISWCKIVNTWQIFTKCYKHSWRRSFWTSFWSLCSKWPPLALTQALRRVRHCLIALSIYMLVKFIPYSLDNLMQLNIVDLHLVHLLLKYRPN